MCYEGEWENDSRNGRGNQYWTDGKKFQGLWKYGQKHGKGKLYNANGDWYEGEWKEGSLNGKVLHIMEDGRGVGELYEEGERRDE